MMNEKPSTVLIVEDDPSLRDSLRRTLRKKGYTIIEAEEGGQGLKLLKAHAVDVVLIDIFMPGKEGIETIQQIRRSHPQVKIIAMSGGGERMYIDVLRVAKSCGCHLTLDKPFSEETLINAIQAQLA
ncbi:MAG: response regulator [Nitrospira sp.]|jgi:DNA-binding response OmpR family regulator|nr:response regulator [Nitrospira sp.]OYT21247.1 MAG: response regulator [Nitrospira sp. UW-LDO-01]